MVLLQFSGGVIFRRTGNQAAEKAWETFRQLDDAAATELIA
jgi:hypothetical protein